MNFILINDPNEGAPYQYIRQLTEGLGKSIYLNYDFETSDYDTITGFIKSGDTTGLILTGIQNVPSSYHFATWPNPAFSQIHFLLPEATALRIEIIGIEGKTHQPTWTSNSTSFEVDVAELKPSLYLLRVITENGTSVSRFIKQ